LTPRSLPSDFSFNKTEILYTSCTSADCSFNGSSQLAMKLMNKVKDVSSLVELLCHSASSLYSQHFGE
jgi:hypothetical protein